MFTELAERLYALVIQKRQFGFYINNLKLYSIPNALTSFAYPPNPITSSDVPPPPVLEADKICDLRYYNELLNSIPNEYISPSVILHCMVEQVVATEEKKPLPSETRLDPTIPQFNNLSQEVSTFLSHMVSNLALEDKDKQVNN